VYRSCFQGLAQLAACLVNDLQATGVKLFPPIARMQARMKALGAMGALMSGSGPTVYGLFPSQENAEKALNAIQGSGNNGWTYLVARGINALELASDVLDK
jgi:4-diphosphocytidyl-2-C-methyl-D-erythritol kinase